MAFLLIPRVFNNLSWSGYGPLQEVETLGISIVGLSGIEMEGDQFFNLVNLYGEIGHSLLRLDAKRKSSRTSVNPRLALASCERRIQQDVARDGPYNESFGFVRRAQVLP